MIAVIQRVLEARVTVAGEPVSSIGQGLLVLAAVDKNDTPGTVERMAQRLLQYRVFADAEGKMNLNVCDIEGELLIVSQFTLAADTRKGNRPSFSPAAEPATGRRLFNHLVTTVTHHYPRVATGRFGADMKVSLINDGPVTFILETGIRP